ncbi:MAG: response regulator [Spirochaetota bacterium]|nr:response regulator [Spirochaetota bacterium]
MLNNNPITEMITDNNKAIKKVVIVEDSLLILAKIVEMLSYIKEVEISGVSGIPFDAIEKINKQKPDFVILDIKLQGGSGIDVLKKIKISCPNTKVIILTNYAYPLYKLRCIDLGADYFFDKSKDFDKIYELLS